jgi:hypothetical protein
VSFTRRQPGAFSRRVAATAEQGGAFLARGVEVNEPLLLLFPPYFPFRDGALQPIFELSGLDLELFSDPRELPFPRLLLQVVEQQR